MPRLAPGSAPVGLVQRWRRQCDDYVTTLACAPQRPVVAVGTGAGSLDILDAGSGERLHQLHAHPGGVAEVAFAPGHGRLASCGLDGAVRLFRDTGEDPMALHCEDVWAEHVAWSTSGNFLAAASGKRVLIWDANGTPCLRSEEMESTVAALAWNPKQDRLAAACFGGVHIWPVGNRGATRTLAWQGSLISLAWSPDGRVLAAGSQDSTVHFWRLANGRDSEMRGYPSKPRALAWDGRSRLLATSGGESITVWCFAGRGPEGSQPILLEGHIRTCTTLAFGPRSGLLASGGQDARVHVWRCEPPQLLGQGRVEDRVTALQWQDHERAIVAGDASGSVTCWDVAD